MGRLLVVPLSRIAIAGDSAVRRDRAVSHRLNMYDLER